MTERDTTDLLLFATGEMPPQQQDQFSHRLAHDPQLSAALIEIQSLNGRTQDFFSRAQRHEHATLLEARRSAAVRKVSRAIVQRRLEDSARSSVVTRKPWKRPRWAYPVAAAALLIIGFIAFVQWGSNIGGSNSAEEGISFAEIFEDRGGGPRPARGFHSGVFPMDEGDFDTLQLSANGYDVSTMFKTDDVN